MKWADLELTLLLQNSGSISAAAQVAGVQQSTLTRRLRDFEARVGQSVFVRTPEGVIPTRFGESILEHAYRAEVAVLEARREVERQSGAMLEGDVTLATLFVVADYIIAPELPNFLEQYPGIRLKIVPDSRISDLTRLEADIAIRFVRPTGGDLVVKKLFDTTARPHAAPSLAKRLRRQLPEEWPWLSLPAPAPEKSVLDRQGVEPRVLFSSATTMVEAARAGTGVALVGEGLGDLLGLELLEAPQPWSISATMWLVTHEDLRKTPVVDAVWNWLLDGASTTPG